MFVNMFSFHLEMLLLKVGLKENKTQRHLEYTCNTCRYRNFFLFDNDVKRQHLKLLLGQIQRDLSKLYIYIKFSCPKYVSLKTVDGTQRYKNKQMLIVCVSVSMCERERKREMQKEKSMSKKTKTISGKRHWSFLQLVGKQ